MRTSFWSTVVLFLAAILLGGHANSSDWHPPLGTMLPSVTWTPPKMGNTVDPLVPPLILSAAPDSDLAIQATADKFPVSVLQHGDGSRFDHDQGAFFHPHGEQVCSSGCAVSRHPTEQLTRSHFQRLLTSYESQPVTASGPALDELLFYGPQTAQLLRQHGTGDLSAARADFLNRQLAFTHARIAIRVIDESGQRRSWQPPTVVPLDRRHVFEMQTDKLQPLVTSGTVKRVGLDHLWTRL